jgi:hypothetical protein
MDLGLKGAIHPGRLSTGASFEIGLQIHGKVDGEKGDGL